MGDQAMIQNPDDPREYVAYLRSIGVTLGTIGEATADLDPAVEPVARNVIYFSTTTDPLEKEKAGEPDNLEFGTDMEFVASLRPLAFPVTLPEVEAAVTEVVRRRRKKKKKPVTPD
jgi:hypothetical protein